MAFRLTKIANAILDSLYPPSCYFCHRPGAWICPQCWAKINFRSPQKCPVCERGSYLGLTHPHCRRRNELDGLFYLFPYREPWRAMLHDYKYRFVRRLTSVWQQLIATSLQKHHPDLLRYWQKEKVVIVPVPLHPSRRLWRGFNQAQELAKIISQISQRPLQLLAGRRHLDRHQAKLNAQQRASNITPANFFLRRQRLKGNFLLVDDVVTTGTTFRALATLLKKHGANHVSAFALLG